MRVETRLNSATPFVHVTDIVPIRAIVESRLPRFPNIFNMTKIYDAFQDVMEIYALDPHGGQGNSVILSQETWIVIVLRREGAGPDISISTPLDALPTDYIKASFMNAPFINWKEAYMFTAVDRPVCIMFTEISLIMGNMTTVHPCYIYHCPIEDAIALNTSSTDDSFELRPLNASSGVDFITRTWKYAQEVTPSYIAKVIERNESSGIYVDGQPVSGIITNGAGLMSALYTLKEHRNKRYGKICMQGLIQRLARKGFIPTSCVEINNEGSKRFHDSVGMKTSQIVDFVLYNGLQEF